MIYLVFIFGLLYYYIIVRKFNFSRVLMDLRRIFLRLYKIQISKKMKMVLGSLSFLFLFWVFCFHYTDSHQVAIARNEVSGELWLDDKPGPNISAPWVKVVRIDIRPMRVCVSTSSRSFNCRLVEFDKNGWREFVETEGFRYYWWDNRFSYNSGYDDEYRGMKDLLRGYSFDSEKRKFIKVTKTIE